MNKTISEFCKQWKNQIHRAKQTPENYEEISIRIDPELRAQTTEIFKAHGLTEEEAIRLFFIAVQESGDLSFLNLT